MPSRVIRQPNEKLAVFSTVVDDFTVMDADQAEILEYFAESSDPLAAQEKLNRGILDLPCDNPGEDYGRFQGLGRWCECLTTIMFTHGWAKAWERIQVGTTLEGATHAQSV